MVSKSLAALIRIWEKSNHSFHDTPAVLRHMLSAIKLHPDSTSIHESALDLHSCLLHPLVAKQLDSEDLLEALKGLLKCCLTSHSKARISMKALKHLKNTMSLVRSIATQEAVKLMKVSLIVVLRDCLLKEENEKNADMAVALLWSLDEQVSDFYVMLIC